MIPALEGLEQLREGNRRFISDVRGPSTRTSQECRRKLVAAQEPFAIILGCADSRVPPEILFDQALGDLFVIRVAGNVAAPSQIGSIEFAAEQFHTRLVVVLGHSSCGAVQATLKELDCPSERRSPHLCSIIDSIRPSVEALRGSELQTDPDALMRYAVRANIRATTHRLRHTSQILVQLIQAKELLIVGAEYSLDTGVVDFFDGLPGSN